MHLPSPETKKYILICTALLFLIILASGIISLYQKVMYYTGKGEAYSFPQRIYEPKQPLAEFEDGIWLHRVNSTERAEYYLSEYAGFEIDIWYDSSKNAFNVDHDNRDYNTSLHDMFSVLANKADVYIWLDFKNLNNENKGAGLARLNGLMSEFPSLKNHIIVESPQIRELEVFHNQGIITSFYFTPPSGPDWREAMGELQKQFYNSGITAVSSDLVNYDLAKAAFSNVPLLFWDMRSYDRKISRLIAAHIRRNILLHEPNIKVLLVGETELAR